MAERRKVLILGAGPAGLVVARRLAALGHVVQVVGSRRAPAWEGLSARVVETLRRIGSTGAAYAAGAAVLRSAHWDGETSAHNEEFLVARRSFDDALREDAVSIGIPVMQASVASLARADGVWVARDADGHCIADGDFLVEARGRRAPSGGRPLIAGPPTVAVARLFIGPRPDRPGTAAASFADGWAWIAVGADGCRLLQFFVCGDAVPPRQALTDLHERLGAQVPQAPEWLDGARPLGEATARDARPVLRGDLVSPTHLRVGDAAYTVDPLSGNGVFEALRSAYAASAAVNTLLTEPDRLPLVRRFIADRARDLFLHGAATGRAFYRLERRWPQHAFWRKRAAWPPDTLLPRPVPGFYIRPVVVDDRITEREVLVTPHHPRGVLTVDGVEASRFKGAPWLAS